MGGNDCAFNYATMPSRDVCVIWLRPDTAGGPWHHRPPTPTFLTDECPNLLILPTGDGGGECGGGEAGGGLYMTSGTPRLAAPANGGQ